VKVPFTASISGYPCIQPHQEAASSAVDRVEFR
jgi:hypothetical protein